jgi:predicted deacylase
MDFAPVLTSISPCRRRRPDPAPAVLATVFHGRRPGAVLVLTAGVHGFEYAPILAAQQLRDRIDPRTLAGTVILVRLAHVAAFEQRVPFVNPFDRKNLNRVFPGTADARRPIGSHGR